MASRAALIKRKPKVVRSTRSEQYLINKKYLGEEPIITSETLAELDVNTCLNWYNYMCTNSDAREYIKTYYKNIGQPQKIKILSKVSDTHLPTTTAWLVRMISRGYKPSGTTMQFISAKLEECLTKAKDDEPKTEQTKAVFTIQDRMRERQSEIIGEVEGILDDYLEAPGDFSFYNWLQSNEISTSYIPKIIEKLAPRLEEILEASKAKSGDLVEAYAYCKKKDFDRMINFFTMMIDDAKRYAGNTKKVRATRKPKVISIEKKIKDLKWQKEDGTYKIASIAPEQIIGAQELWTFNTKNKTLTVFRALDRGGLQVKGTSITNYDDKNSYSRSTGRKPEEYIKRTLEGGKIILRKLMDELKTEKTLAYRINESTILLRVIK